MKLFFFNALKTLSRPTHSRQASWNLDGVSDIEASIQFLKQLETTLCLFNSTTQRLYCEFSTEAASRDQQLFINTCAKNTITLPSDFDESILTSTGMFIVPSFAIGKSESSPFLAWNSTEEGYLSFAPLSESLAKLRQWSTKNTAFIPVICTGHLRSEKQYPQIQLYRLNITDKQGATRAWQTLINTIEAKLYVETRAAA
jgi:hypothetical protein